MRRWRRENENLFWAGLLLMAAYLALYNGLTVKRYELSSPKISQPLRLVVLADLHGRLYGPEQRKLIELIKSQKPDLILMVGDIVGDAAPFDGVVSLLEGLEGRGPIYYVTGNHEFWSGKMAAIRALMRKFQVNLLEGTFEFVNIKGNTLVMAGLDDPEKGNWEDHSYDQRQVMAEAFGRLADRPGYKILLAHHPEMIEEYRQYPFDLVVSGHAHGGQIRIPVILNGLYAPDQDWFPKYAGGRYRHGELNHIVSRGLSGNLIVPRIFNPSELVVIDICPETAKGPR